MILTECNKATAYARKFENGSSYYDRGNTYGYYGYCCHYYRHFYMDSSSLIVWYHPNALLPRRARR